jgi:hypothetical protein
LEGGRSFIDKISLIKFSNKNPFLIRKTTPRKTISRSPFKLSGADLAREFGPWYQIVDVRIGQQRMVLDIAQGSWIPGNSQSIYDILFLFLLFLQKKQMKQKLTLKIWVY